MSHYPELDANQQHHLISGGLDQVWVKSQPLNSTTEIPQSKIVRLSVRVASRREAEIQNLKSKIGAAV